jgi:AraC-like DNA-binding protein
MGAVETFSTHSIPHGQQVAYWDRIAADIFPGMSVNVRRKRFDASISHWQLGPVDLARACAQRSSVSRRRGDDTLSDPGGSIVVHLQQRGFCEVHQDGRCASMSVGDMVFCDPTSAYRIEVSDHNDCLIIQMPLERLEGVDASILDLRACTFSANPTLAVFRQYLLALWSDANALDGGSEALGDVLAQLASVVLRAPTSKSPVISRLRQNALPAMLDHVERHLTDPDLGTASIARCCGISPRTVQDAFARMATTPNAHVTQLRLKKARALLLRYPQRSVTEIAFEVGFNDSAYFSRRFRRHFGLSPIECRQRHGQ